MDIAMLEAQEKRLILPGFDEATAWLLGQRLVEAGMAAHAPVSITIRIGGRVLFHAGLPGGAALNDLWALRKANTVLMFGESSMLVTLRHREKNRPFDVHGFEVKDHALSGGGVPIRVAGVGMVAAAAVSGLAQEEDHALVVRGIETLL
jgi:uncharacterized protein (UPF0303 family)